MVEKDLDCSPDFKVYRKDKYTNSGGLCAWIRLDIPQREMYELNFTSCTPHLERFIFELTIKKEKLYIILAYKNPNVSNALFLKKVTEVYEHLMNKGKENLLLGDLNINMLSEENEIKNNLMDVYNLTIDPTCFKRPGGALINPLIIN